MKVKKLKICLGIIARNDADMLRRFLPNLSYSLDRNVVSIDYESSDTSGAILNEYAKYNVKMPWPNDFGKAKTQVITMAEELGYDWMILMDADETLEHQAMSKIRSVIEHNKYTAYFLPRIYYQDLKTIEGSQDYFPDPQARIFKLNMGYYYNGKRHCVLQQKRHPKCVWDEKSGAMLPFYIYHYRGMKGEEVLKKIDNERLSLRPEVGLEKHYKAEMPIIL